ncbi:MAG TPA: glycine zipper family protein [Accumulibacter sp.]|uniref:glycine zipper domain-containing protein n=1 Tax=Accumulibacter sp. TaxID=2053492 RepID=UPI0025FFB7F4|nr:glycine zipper domain-containing protein [Accumulibacter sp.]MCM8598929.1 glycine zipper family protein [Accumulibacter sp.]MCM8663083.1 glycine zipper family protein [Accumulibacter sp.]HNC52031.1 glycine zipper family protein [Accumulibacter sp.]
MERRPFLLPLAALLLLAGCVTAPTGPTVLVLPGQQKSFDQFRNDDIACQQYAQAFTAPAGQAANDAAVGTAAAATAIGAAAGAIIGSASGQAGQGAAIGAGTGLLFGGAMGSNTVYATSYDLQRRYDIAYMQCMYARGNQVPGQVVQRRTPPAYPLNAGPPSAVYPPANTPAPDMTPQFGPPPGGYPLPNTPPPQGVPYKSR